MDDKIIITDEEDSLEEDFLIIDDLDLGDESELRQVVVEVESLVKAGGRGIRISVLTTDQWQTVLQKMLPPSLRRTGTERYIHTLRDPTDAQHLLVSPSAVVGINEKHSQMYQELVYALLRCLPTSLKGILLKGLNDIVAEACSKKIKVKFFIKNNPEETLLVKNLIKMLRLQYGYSELEWALELRRNPDRFFTALRRSEFTRTWLQEAKENQELLNHLKGKKNASSILTQMLQDPHLEMDSNLVLVTQKALQIHKQSGEKE